MLKILKERYALLLPPSLFYSPENKDWVGFFLKVVTYLDRSCGQNFESYLITEFCTII